MVNHLAQILTASVKAVFLRKLAKNVGMSKENAFKMSTALGAGAIAVASVAKPCATLAELGLPSSPEYELIIRITIASLGLYAFATEKRQ